MLKKFSTKGYVAGTQKNEHPKHMFYLSKKKLIKILHMKKFAYLDMIVVILIVKVPLKENNLVKCAKYETCTILHRFLI